MEKKYEIKYHSLEDNYFWFRGRRDIIIRILSDVGKGKRILDIGCASGVLLHQLKGLGYTDLCGLDISEEAVSLAKERGLRNIFLMDGNLTSFENESFDIVIASDVLEHIKNDVSALKEWHRILKVDGTLIIFVPAFSALWSYSDIVNRHYRRYNLPHIVSKLNAAAFTISRQSYWNFLLFFPMSILRKLQRGNQSKPKDSLYVISNLVNKLLTFILKIENTTLSFLNFPLGVSAFAVANKC